MGSGEPDSALDNGDLRIAAAPAAKDKLATRVLPCPLTTFQERTQFDRQGTDNANICVGKVPLGWRGVSHRQVRGSSQRNDNSEKQQQRSRHYD